MALTKKSSVHYIRPQNSGVGSEFRGRVFRIYWTDSFGVAQPTDHNSINLMSCVLESLAQLRYGPKEGKTRKGLDVRCLSSSNISPTSSLLLSSFYTWKDSVESTIVRKPHGSCERQCQC